VAELDALERDLFALGREIDWPPTPVFRLQLKPASPSPSLGEGPPRQAGRRRLYLALLAAAVATALGAGAVAAGYLHIPGVNIQRSSRPLPTPSASAPSTPLGTRLDLGSLEPSLAAAQAAAGFPVQVPSALGQPDFVFYKPSPVPLVSLVYSPRPDLPAGTDPEVGALFMEFRSSAGGLDFIGKLVGPDTRIEQVTVNGVPGVWLEGAPHEVFIQPSPGGGSVVADRVRLAGNTLIWYQDGVTYRLEAKVSKARALEIAGTVG
jgi:hypothetical protein